ncbi:uroporphyrinogen decarboxylase family protein [Limnoglobus roseus]|uniref:Uroporphyrinogen decarboxylase n=1 Tax=Limnoglobus roseus TaxID=2598579 RepID=A0A5C1AHZ9_9BACT|nr:uroporphyrinogen decarboxylase family protein [Limnoglobus roseus]QEL17883.1 uroporphyrinogen decarboxylase [Limnoglobus roseus]
MPSSSHLLVRAARGEPIERVPVWAMRQAGRWDPEFNKVRAGLPFFEFSENVEKALLGTLCPRRLGVDAIILFYDITTLPLAMGLPFELKKDIGPQPDRPIRTLADLNRLNPEPPPESYGHIRQLLRRTKEELKGELPVIVFAGSPFTVATYCIGTGKDVAATRRFAAEQPQVWDGLLERLTVATGGFLRTLIGDGADIYQLFDSWAGMLTPDEYERWAQRQHAAIFRAATGVPRILFVKECPYLDRMAETGAEVISLGLQHDLAAARKLYPHLSFQGNVSEETLRTGTPEQVEEAVRACLRAGGGQRHIMNLNHGVGKETPVANFEAYIRAAKAGL